MRNRELTLQYLENPEDLSPLTDANFVSATLKKIGDGVPPPMRARRAAPAPTGRATLPGRVTANSPSSWPTPTPPTPVAQPQVQGKPWPGLGKRVDVLHLTDIEQGVRDLSI